MNRSESILKFAPALVKAQKEMEGATKGKDNPFFKSKYADLPSVLEACKASLNNHGISIVQSTDVLASGGKLVPMLETILLHESGEYISGIVEIRAKDINDPQKFGAGLTYARRQGLQSLAVIPADDDDGNAASGKNNSSNVSKKPNKPVEKVVQKPVEKQVEVEEVEKSEEPKTRRRRS